MSIQSLGSEKKSAFRTVSGGPSLIVGRYNHPQSLMAYRLTATGPTITCNTFFERSFTFC